MSNVFTEMAGSAVSYEGDFYAWANGQAVLLRAGRLSEIDAQNIAEELETLGRSEKRELVNRLAVLLLHLLKWQFQPALQGNSWRLTIEIQRRDLDRHLNENPSLQSHRDQAMLDAYGDALIQAERETGYPRGYFPRACPYQFEQIMDETYWPEPI